MRLTSTPEVFKNFSTTSGLQNNTTQQTNDKNSTDSTSTTSNLAVYDDKDFLKTKKNHKVAKGLLLTAGAIVAASFAIPFARHNLFSEVNPADIDITKNTALAKRGFIVFSDQLEVRRRIIGNRIKDGFKKFKNMIASNVFAYTEKERNDTLPPLGEAPQNCVNGLIKWIHAAAEDIITMCHKIDIDYSRFGGKK